MKIIKYRDQLIQLDQLIRLEATGSPTELAYKLKVCEKTVHNLLNIMREFAMEHNVNIVYDNYARNYYYTQPVKFNFGFELINRKG